MPYPLSLQAYTPREFYERAPEAWERRLREISPEMSNLDRLVFRYWDPTNPDGSDRGWVHPERGQWSLYTAKPVRMVEKERAQQFEKHWSELHETQQVGRRAIVSDYQHFMWHSQGLYVRPFLILQGPWGGTPCKYSEAEQAFLQASACESEPFPVGTFEACPFDERTVKTIAIRDRLVQCDNNLAELTRLDTPDAMRSETEAAQLLKRNTYLDTMAVLLAPSIEFMKSYISTKKARQELPAAPPDLAINLGKWKDTWLEHGSIIGAGPARTRQLRVPVTAL